MNTLSNLLHFQLNADEQTFNEIFGEDLGIIYWDIYKLLNFNILILYNELDSERKEKLEKYLSTYNPSGDKLYVVAWYGQYEPDITLVKQDFFHEDRGYDEEEIDSVNDLAIGEGYYTSEGDHTIIRKF